MNLKNLLISTIVATLASTLIVFAIVKVFTQSEGKAVYVDLGKLYNEFELTKELEVNSNKIKTTRQNILDSIEFRLKALSSQIQDNKGKDKLKIEEFEIQRSDYILKKQQFEQANENMVAEYNEQIWTQLNQFIKDFGKKKDYEYIFGAEGSGAIMYGKDSYDITDELITYTNSKFKGK